MPKEIIYNKLIRDKIPEIIEKNGNSCRVGTLTEKSFQLALKKKLQEEVKEYLLDDNLEELADILEVIYALLKVKGSSPEKLEEIRQKKVRERGGFEKRLLLKWVNE